MFVVTSVTTADGGTVTSYWDMNGDGVTERIQRITTVVDAVTGLRTETEQNWRGSSIAVGVKDSRIVTATSADGKQVTISRDHAWGGWLNTLVGWHPRYGLLYNQQVVLRNVARKNVAAFLPGAWEFPCGLHLLDSHCGS